jgi:hypothetical protein
MYSYVVESAEAKGRSNISFSELNEGIGKCFQLAIVVSRLDLINYDIAPSARIHHYACNEATINRPSLTRFPAIMAACTLGHCLCCIATFSVFRSTNYKDGLQLDPSIIDILSIHRTF